METTVDGLVIGSLYALVALGPCLVYGLLRVLDIANAAALTLGGYLVLVLAERADSPLLGVLAGLAAGAVLGWAVQRWIYLPILDRGPIVTLVTGIGLYIVATELFRLVFGPSQRSAHVDLPLPDVALGGVRLEGIDLLILAVTLGVIGTTWYVLTRTRSGVLWQAVAQDRRVAGAVGVNSPRVIAAVFAVGYLLSALAGALLSVKYDAVYPTLGDIPAYKMLAIIILGGLGSPLGTIVAALLIGLVESWVVASFGFALPRDAIAFVALIVMLLIRPQGLIPSRVVKA